MIYKKNYTKQNVEEEEKIVYTRVFVCVYVKAGSAIMTMTKYENTTSRVCGIAGGIPQVGCGTPPVGLLLQGGRASRRAAAGACPGSGVWRRRRRDRWRCRRLGDPRPSRLRHRARRRIRSWHNLNKEVKYRF
jgi:hypothetical protein